MLLSVSVLAWTLPQLAPSCASATAAFRLRLPSHALTMQQHDADDDFDMAAPEVELMEPETGRILPCFMAASLEYEGETYAALYPVNAPVTLAEEAGGRLVPLDEDRETDGELLAACVKACADGGIELLQTPVVLTACGPGLELVDDDSMRSLELSDDDDDDDESEEALVLARLQHGGDTVMVLQTLDPLYVVGKKLEDESYVVPTDDEVDAVQDTIEQLVVEFEEGFEEEDDFEDLDEFAA